MEIYRCCMCHCGLQAYSGRTSVYLCDSSFQNLEVPQELYFTGPCPCRTILLALYSMVWDWQVLRAVTMLFYWPSCSILFCLLEIPLSLLSVYGLVLWGWGLWTAVIGCKSLALALPSYFYKKE